MTDPIKPRRKVTAQISLAPSSSPIASSSTSNTPVQPRIRAKIASSSNTPSPSPSTRPSIRSTPSSTSLRTSTPSSRARSPVPPPTQTTTPHARVTARTPTHSNSTPVTSSRTAPTSALGGSSHGTPVARIRATKSVVDGGGGSPHTPNHGVDNVTTRTRALSLKDTPGSVGPGPPVVKVRPSITVSTPIRPAISRQSTSSAATQLIVDTTGSTSQSHGVLLDTAYATETTWTRHDSPEKLDIDVPGPSSNRSSPSHAIPRGSPTLPPSIYAHHTLAHVFPHPTASAPTSPIPFSNPAFGDPPRSAPRNLSHAHGRPRLPFNPHTNHPPPLPLPPGSPELKPVDLPVITPARSSEEWSRTGTSSRKYSASGSERSAVLLDMTSERDRLSGATAVEVEVVDENGLALTKGRDVEVDDVLETNAEEAKVNRKIADLEISNASLLAINKMLEATKSKQRTEIIKLRRMLRESLAGGAIHSLPFLAASTSNAPPHSPLGLFSPTIDTDEIDPTDLMFEEEMADPQLDARWDNIADLVSTMKRRGEMAIEKGKEEVKVGPGRVLGWAEMEERGDMGDVSVDSIAMDGAGETTLEDMAEVDGVVDGL
ncbi:hypothetical protein CI109_104485 [Kwoniella shandongensis]|uniref:Uncharacterized protein n=1 Tax=Kwoniella shandongensis TaxID=1734106 RepID=A0A5M6BPN3_9TREE|nr:uncharacterized protein CI109_006814 [Kwoniella shandongensis]KAA5524864.1 hypothetical protein CI109_006814 [Kwoniella shandongensis]